MTAVKKAGELADLIELRLDLIGPGWRELTGHLTKPWIACNRRAEEGGSWRGDEAERIKELLSAVELGVNIIDIELSTPGVEKVVRDIKGRADCLISYHNVKETPPPGELRDIIERQLELGAGICKAVTTARSLADNIAVLRLIKDFPKVKVVAFAMGEVGQISRVLAPLVGGYFTYASIEAGGESAPGQLPIGDLRKIYGMLDDA
jgi:3-dehydroquinate dehydratase type I